jgi:HlyD family secretion protein
VELETAEYNMNSAKLSVDRSKNEVAQARLNLSYATIKSPIDGVVLKRAVEVGQTVAASMSTPTLFVIAKNLSQMKVMADVDEADIGQVKAGQKVSFTVDAFQGETFSGSVQEVRLNPTTTSNVVTYTVIIEAPNPDQKLFPGMTASVTIVTEEETGLAVPAEAFNFTPDEAVLKAIRKADKPEGQRPQPPQGERPQMGEKGMADHDVVWVKHGDDMSPRPVKVGMSDGAYKIVEQGVQAGDSVVLSAQYVVKEKAVKKGENPFMPGPPGRNRNNSNKSGNAKN